MRRNGCWLAALGAMLALVAVCQAAEWTSAPGGAAVPAVAPPSDLSAPRGNKCQRLWQWLTYHSLRTPCCHGCKSCGGGCGTCCRGCASICQPHLYEYFLAEHPGCCHGDIQPVAAVHVEAPAQEWRSDTTELPAPRPLPDSK